MESIEPQQSMTEERLELHYHLVNDAHSMDALVRNKCEAEVLALVRHVAKELGVDAVLESSAFTEGGLREVFKFLMDPKNNSSLVMGGMVLVLIQIVISILALPSTDKEQEALTKELTKLSIEEKKLQIEKLRREAGEGKPSEETVAEVVSTLNQDYKVLTRRSNFYSQLLPYKKVTAVGFGHIPTGEVIPKNERTTLRADFERFLVRENKLPELVDEAACIEIVAPVITGGNMHWKGLYQGEPISFAMRDSDYKQAVSNRTVSFQHGDSIACLLHTERKLDPTGEIIVTGRYVSLVLEKRSSSGQSAETPQGRRKKFSDKLVSAQSSLPFSPPNRRPISCRQHTRLARAKEKWPVALAPGHLRHFDLEMTTKAFTACPKAIAGSNAVLCARSNAMKPMNFVRAAGAMFSLGICPPFL